MEISHGSPRPRKTLTEFDPFTLPMALSAYFSLMAAEREANMSGMDVPKATSVMAVIVSDMPRTQPKIEARSAMIAVRTPRLNNANKKVNQPPNMPVGGIKAKRTCIF